MRCPHEGEKKNNKERKKVYGRRKKLITIRNFNNH